MKKLLLHSVLITDGGKYSSPKNEFFIKEVDVLAENKMNLVIDDIEYSTIAKNKSDYRTCLDSAEISISANDSFWGNRIRYTLYSYSKKRAKTIRKEIEAKIDSKFGFYLRGLDLSLIQDATP